MPQVRERDGGSIDRGGRGPGGGRGGSGSEAFPVPNSKLAVWILLAVLTVLFSAIVSAYLVRMDLPDWKSPPKLGILWLNTALLGLSSLFFQRASWAARKGEARGVHTVLRLGGLFGGLFIVGQLVAWGMLRGAGFLIGGNPSSSFFYFITALHGLHLLGGLVAWAVVSARPTPLRIELCTLYWHFLLVVWLVLYGLLLFT
ncbi:MAG: cytochrome oxidase subunit III [Meiothermus sp.]